MGVPCVQALAPARLPAGTWQRRTASSSAAEDGPSTSGPTSVPPSSRRSGAPLRRTLAFAGPQRQDGAPAAPNSTLRLLAAGRLASPLSAPAAATGQVAALVVRPQEAGGASLLQLVAAWDQLAARLPPQARGGHAAEVILAALKLAVACAPPPAADPSSAAAAAAAALAAAAAGGDAEQQQAAEPQVAALSQPVARGLAVAARLADLAADGLPIDAESIAAGILAEALLAGQHAEQHGYSVPATQQPAAGTAAAAASFSGAAGGSGGLPAAAASSCGPLTLTIIEERMGPIVAQLVHDVQRARQLPGRVELLDDQAAAVLREVCLSFYDVRATAVEVVARLELLSSPGSLPSYEAQVAALEALQMYAPMGHALGLSAVASQLEDRCFQILFPESYERTAAWLREQAVANADVLAACKRRLAAAVQAHPRFEQLAGGLEVHGRTKTLFSTLKKLLRLGNTAAGGRARTQLYDLMGLRAIVVPRDDLPADEAEELAAQACYIVREAACSLWQCVEGRSKDYIAAPKPNGYQSLHSTMRVQSSMVSLDLAASSSLRSSSGGSSDSEDATSHATLELQIRTQAMHERAEMGDAAHAAYKGGLDAQQTLQLKELTESVLRRAAAAAAAASSAVVAGSSASSGDAAAEALFRHLDQNGDGRISLEELQFALEELGVREAQAQSRAAAELLQLAAAQDGSGEDDGTIGFDAFMALQRKVGLLQAISAVDHEQALLLAEEPHAAAEEQQWAGSAGLVPNAPFASSSFDSDLDSVIFTDAAGQPFSPRSRGSRGSFPAAAAACRAGGSSSAAHGGLRWRQQQGWLGSGRWGGFGRRAGVVAHAFIDVSNAYSSGSSTDSLDSEAVPANGSGSGGMAAKRVDSSVRNSVVALHGSNHATLSGSSSSASANGSSSSSSSPNGNGSSSSNGSSPLADAEAQPAAPLLQGKPQRVAAAAAAANTQQPEGPAPLAAAGQAAAGWRPPPAMQGIVRLVTQPGPTTADATWQLVPVHSNRVGLLDAAGQPLPAAVANAAGQRVQALPMPAQGPCVVGGAFDRDCAFIVDAPTVSGRHVRLEVVRLRDAKGGHSRLVLTDLGSTNGTWVNRGRIEAHRPVTLRPGDVICLAEPDISFEVAVTAPPAPASAAAASNGAAASAAGVADAPAPEAAAADAQQAVAALPAVVAALRLAGALEAAAAEQGLFPPGGAVSPDVPDRVRQLMADRSHDQAYVLLLAGVMQQPWAAGLWAQLANAERHRARLGCRPGSFGAARAFYAAAADAFAALTPSSAGSALCAAAERAEGLSRVYSSWAQLELSLGHSDAARTLFRKGIAAAHEHPAGAAAAGAPRQLVRWASLEWKAGEAAAAQRLCVEALELDPSNAHALTQLGTIEAAARQWVPARRLFKRAVEVDPGHVAALQAWGRLEAAAGKLKQARRLFQDALRQQPDNLHVLLALAVAEARLGDAEAARSLFRRCTEADPSCTAAWHAWAKLEDECGRADAARHLYHHALQLEPRSVPTLSALGCLERRAGNLEAAAEHLEAALAADREHVPSLHELALVREEQGRRQPARRLKKRASWLSVQRRSALREAAFQKLPPAAAGPAASDDNSVE